MKKYTEMAAARHPDAKNKALLMMGDEEHSIRNEVMRKNVFLQLKQKHIHDFKRKVIDSILKEREKLPGYSSP